MPCGPFKWLIPTSYKPGMKVPGLIFASESMLDAIRADQAPEQVANAAFLPGVVGYSIAMPDVHYGYGLPIGGVVATRPEDGVVSPGGVGYDINCGVRLLRSELERKDVEGVADELLAELYARIPSGVGSSGGVRLTGRQLADVVKATATPQLVRAGAEDVGQDHRIARARHPDTHIADR